MFFSKLFKRYSSRPSNRPGLPPAGCVVHLLAGPLAAERHFTVDPTIAAIGMRSLYVIHFTIFRRFRTMSPASDSYSSARKSFATR